jgi:uncharacterized OB-fold protein
LPVAPAALWSLGREPSLLASRDLATGELVFPPFPENSPLAARHETVPIADVGVVYSYSVIHPNPKSGQTPYAVGYVDLPGPTRIFGRLAGTSRPVIGERRRARADATCGYRFETVDAGATA